MHQQFQIFILLDRLASVDYIYENGFLFPGYKPWSGLGACFVAVLEYFVFPYRQFKSPTIKIDDYRNVPAVIAY